MGFIDIQHQWKPIAHIHSSASSQFLYKKPFLRNKYLKPKGIRNSSTRGQKLKE